MSDLTPVTREEIYLNALQDGGTVPKPVTREEMLLKAILDGTEPPFEPVTRVEMFLAEIAKNGTGSNVELLDKSIDLSLAAGDQIITAEDGTGYKSITIKKPETLVPENIAKDVDIAGIIGKEPTETAIFEKVATVTVSYTASKVDLTKYEWYDKITADDIYIVPQAFTVFSTVEGETTGSITCGTYALNKSYSNGILTVSRASVSGKVGINFPADIYVYAELEENPLTASFIGVLDGTMANPVLPEGLTSIGDYAFYHNETIENLVLPDGITSIGEDAFYYCSNLALTSLPNGITSVGKQAFAYCHNLALTSLPDGITSIAVQVFRECRNLALTSLPDGITSIGDLAFGYCTKLALTSLPSGLTSISTNAFISCPNLALTSLPDGITSIGQGAFRDCEKLALTELPDTVVRIIDAAFYNCPNLALTSLPEKIYTIGTNAFANCNGLTEITFEGKPNYIYASAFSGCTNLLTINVPWAEGEVANAPWGATNATINYNYTGE